MYMLTWRFVKGNFTSPTMAAQLDQNRRSLPRLPIHTIAIGRTNSQILYVGTDVGVSQAEDGVRTGQRPTTAPPMCQSRNCRG